MRNAAKLIGASAASVGALPVLTSFRATGVDAAADVLLIASLLTLVHTVFHLVDEPGRVALTGEGERSSRNREDGPRGARHGEQR